MVNVKGRWALITGAARGIGYLTAKFMAEKGCNLILHSRNITHTEKVAEEVKAMGVEAYTVQAELSDLDSVKKMLEEIDPESADAIHPNNTKRVIRAIEYYRLSGEKISDHNKKTAMMPSPYDHIYIGLTRERENLYERIDKRVDLMVSQGLVEEVCDLWKKGCTLDMTSMQALGYKEFIWYINGKCTLCEAIRILKRDSRRYAKRQLTWFNRNKNINWINISEYESEEEIIKDIIQIINSKFCGKEVPCCKK